MRNTKLHFIILAALILLGLLLFKRCSKDTSEEKPTVKTTIVYKYINDTIVKTEFKYTTLPGKITKEYIPSSNCDTLKKQFISVRDKYLAINILDDKIQIDTLGYIAIKDTIQENKIKSRTIIRNYKLPTIIKEITLPAKPKTQVYIGASIYGSKQDLFIAAPGLLLKTKKDNIYQINAGITSGGQVVIGGGLYYKIKLKN